MCPARTASRLKMAPDVISWVVGRGGLLGQHVEQALATKGAVWRPGRPFSWDHPNVAARELTIACREFAAVIGDEPWQIAWCAGAGIVGSEASDLEHETRAVGVFLDAVKETLCRPNRGRGGIFLASSAGGVYAGVGTPPFSEESAVAPLAPYGWNKLKQEELARHWSVETQTPVFIGRLSNLYGPGQKLSKAQGLITQVCLRMLNRQPLSLYVPGDTIRDYLFAKDAGRLVADGLTRLRQEFGDAVVAASVTKILASHQPVTVSTVLAQIRRVLKRPVSVIISVTPNTARQARDLRMTSSVWPDIDRHPVVTLGEGIRAVLTDILDSSTQRRTAVTSLALG